MVECRLAPLLAYIVGLAACSAPNPLFHLTGANDSAEGSTDGATTDIAETGGAPTTTGPTPDPGSTSDAGTTGLTDPVCGNGLREPGEQCDDGNAIPGDDCEVNCRPLFRPDPAPVEGTEGAVAMALADLDLDGDDDLVLGTPCLDDQACVTTWHNQGDGLLVEGGSTIVSELPARLFVADWNADGAPDILATHTSGFISLIIDGDVINLNFPGDLTSAIVAHLDDDLLPDLLIPDAPGLKIHYVFANGASFTQPNIAAPLHGPNQLAAADVDGDGRTDVLYSIDSGPVTGFSVKLDVVGPDLGPFTSNASNARAIAIGEFAAPPWPNVVYSDPVGDTLQVFSNQGGGAFEKISDTIDAEPDMLRLLAVRINTPDVDNIVALAPTALQLFTYDGGKIVAGPSRNFSGLGIDVAAGELAGDSQVDLAVLTTFGVYLLINQSGE